MFDQLPYVLSQPEDEIQVCTKTYQGYAIRINSTTFFILFFIFRIIDY